MQWEYKTVHYALKKDGLLGGTFLDAEEMELSLNEQGDDGWELISVLEVRDGVVNIFKQEKKSPKDDQFDLENVDILEPAVSFENLSEDALQREALNCDQEDDEYLTFHEQEDNLQDEDSRHTKRSPVLGFSGMKAVDEGFPKIVIE